MLTGKRHALHASVRECYSVVSDTCFSIHLFSTDRSPNLKVLWPHSFFSLVAMEKPANGLRKFRVFGRRSNQLINTQDWRLQLVILFLSDMK